jgi:hypothetical protein
MLKKCKVDKAVETYKELLKTVSEFGLTMTTILDWSTMDPINVFLDRQYAPTGTDNEGRGIMWIKGGITEKEEEPYCVRSGVLYWMAVHADFHTLREGTVLVLECLCTMDSATNHRPCHALGQKARCFRFGMPLHMDSATNHKPCHALGQGTVLVLGSAPWILPPTISSAMPWG